jgi:hypothetical protein
MRRGLKAILGGLLLVLALATGAWANHKVLLYPHVVDLHFADAKGKVHTLAITENVEPSMLGYCDVDEGTARVVAGQRQAELSVMAYLGSTCHGAKFTRTVTAPKMPSDPRPAMVVLFFKATDGQFHYSVFGDKKAGEYDMGTCVLVLKKTQATLLKQVADRHVGQAFQGGECFLRNQNALVNWTNR